MLSEHQPIENCDKQKELKGPNAPQHVQQSKRKYKRTNIALTAADVIANTVFSHASHCAK